MSDVLESARTLPHNLDAERSVLGAVMLRNDAINQATEVIDSGDFFREAHRLIFDKMIGLSERGLAIDLVTLKEELSRAGLLESVGGPAYIASLVDGVPRATNVGNTRASSGEGDAPGLIVGQQDRRGGYNSDQEADGSDTAERTIFEIADGRCAAGSCPQRAGRLELATIEQLQERRGMVTGVPTGFAELDKMTNGLQPSDLIIVAARPSMGKTSFVLNIAQHIGTQTDMTVGFFSLEMSKEQLFMRMLTSEARIDAQKFRTGYLNERDYGKLSAALGVLRDARVYIDDSASIGCSRCAPRPGVSAERGLDMIVVDYIQLMQDAAPTTASRNWPPSRAR
jgi:replicative DNA helicase